MQKDLIVIGGGPGGYTAAIKASKLGLNVILIEKENIGGVCLNKGCIPTKTMHHTAKTFSSINNYQKYGISIKNFQLDESQLFKRKYEVIERLKSGIKHLCNLNKVDIFYGEAFLEDKNTVCVKYNTGTNNVIHAKNILIASGSLPHKSNILGANRPNVLTSDDLLALDKLPTSLTIVGGGIIGIEFASIYRMLGVNVTVIELAPSILPNIEIDISKRLSFLLKKKGIRIFSSSKVLEIKNISTDECSDKSLLVEVEFIENNKEQRIQSEIVLLSIGRKPNILGLNLDLVGINTTNEGIAVDGNYCTNIPGIYAIGDCIGGHMLAHVAACQGEQVALNIAAYQGKYDLIKSDSSTSPKKDKAVPSCIFSFPEIGTVGLTEVEAKSKGISFSISKFMYGANGKAICIDEEEGFIKMIYNSASKKILGVHIMGANASDLINEAALAIVNDMTIYDIQKTIHAHPTLSEIIRESALD